MNAVRKRPVLWALALLLSVASGSGGHAYVVSDAQKPTLADVFDGTARFQTIEESEEVTLEMDVDGKGRQLVWDQKLPILHDAETGEYYTFTRGYVEDTKKFRIVVLTSRDGRTFRQKGILFPELHEDPDERWTLYDAHVAFDGEKYILTTECANRRYGPSLCLSETRTPFDLSSWSRPVPIVKNSPAERQSASTGVALHFEDDTYITWTVVDDSRTPYARVVNGDKVINDEDGDEASFSKAVKLFEDLDGNFVYAGQGKNVGRTIIGVENDPDCRSAWDCNNVDIQDWKVEAGKVYAIYNGSNYYRCFRPREKIDRSNRWSIGIRRADHPLGDYSESSGIVIRSVVDDICGISYPVLNTVGGETYLYYSYYSYGPRGNRINRSMRSRLMAGPPLPMTLRTADRKRGKRASDPRGDALADGIQRLYVKFLDRYPRNDELDAHLERARREGYEYAVRAVVLSKEHRRLWASRDTGQRIASLYQGILDRAPDASGFADFESLIVNEGRSLDDLFPLFVGSPEFRSANR